MAKRILNLNNCTFICPQLAGTISKTQADHKFNDATGIALTKQTALTGKGLCALQNNAPCTMIMCTNWTAGIEENKKINGVPLLNEDAEMSCPMDETIFVRKPLAPIVPSVAVAGTAVNSTSDSKKTSSQKEHVKKEVPKQEKKKENQPENIPEQEKKKEKKQKKQPKKEKNPEKRAMCSYEYCDKISECPYIQAPINTESSSAELGENSPDKLKRYNEMADINMEKNQISWNKQAHHLISGGAAYCKFPELVKLGNYFQYDINCQENCCFLPAPYKKERLGEKDEHFKKARKYDVMKASGLQWHSGKHEYKIDLSESILEKYPHLRGMDCYNVRLHKDLKEIQSACNERFKDICPEKDYENHKNWFIQQMNALSAKIEKHLDLFSSSPKESYPYFVSMEALRYAYEIPRSGKVISIHKTSTQWVLKRYQYTNYLKDSEVQLNLLETKTLTDTENHRDETNRKLIIFCENVTCFLVTDDTKTFKLPFTYRAKCQYIDSSEPIKLESHFSAMLAEQAENDNNDEYISPKAMAVQRLKECGLY